MNVNLSDAQRLQQQLISSFVNDLERQIQRQGSSPLNADLGGMLNDLFSKFDTNKDSRFNSNELSSLAGHLKRLNTEQNIAQLFTSDGQLNFATTSKIDITGDGKFNGQEDLVALQQILGTRSTTLSSQTVNNSVGQVSAGIGNPNNGVKHFNSKGSFFVTEGGFTILTDTNVGGHQTMIYDDGGKLISRIWGDPHVGDGTGAAGGQSWHFGNDSTFILPDGTEILFNTEGNANNNVYITKGLYIKSGNDVYQTGLDFGTRSTGEASNAKVRNSSITKLEISATEFDAKYADAAADINGAGVFAWTRSANRGAGGWAILTEGGVFQDVRNESWNNYLKAGGASFQGQYEGVVGVSQAQLISALDGEAVRFFNNMKGSIKDVPSSNPPIKSDNLFLDYYFKHAASTKELKAFSEMIINSSSGDKMQLLDDYIKNGTNIQLNDSQETKFFNYLVSPTNSKKVAETYLNLLENGADPKKLDLLDKVANGEYELTTSQQNKFLDYLVKFPNTKIAETYLNLSKSGASSSALEFLEQYADGKLGVTLTTAQEDTMLNYLTKSSNSNIARSYVNLLKDNASISALTALDDIFKSTGSIKDVLDKDDLRFRENLNTLFYTHSINMAMVGGSNYNRIINNFQNVSIDLLNSVIDGLLEQHRNTPQSVILRHGTNSILNALGGVLNDPLASISNANSSSAFLNSLLLSNPNATKNVLDLQLRILGDMNQNDQTVINAKNRAELLYNWLIGNVNNANTGLDNAEKSLFDQFLAAFPAGTSPTQAQREAALDLIGGDDFLGDDKEFIANYARFVASGDSASAEKLVEIAKFYGTGANLSSSVKNISNLNMSAEAVDAAYNLIGSTDSPGLMRDLQALAPGDSAINNLVNGTLSNFLLQTLLNGGSSNAFSAGEGAVTNAFVDALENMVENLQPNSISNNQLASLITRSLGAFTSDLQNNVRVTAASQTEIIKRDTNLSRTYTSETAQLQIDIFSSMINFYNNQITAESAKNEPDNRKINQFRSQINSYQTAITALQKIIS